MSIAYYLYASDSRAVLELGKLNGMPPGYIERFDVLKDNWPEAITSPDGTQRRGMVNIFVMQAMLAFLRTHSGEHIHLFDDNQWAEYSMNTSIGGSG